MTMAGFPLDLLALQLVTGMALGAIYVLVGIGLSLIFGLLNVVNFAHGAFFMVGAYVGRLPLRLHRQFLVSLVAVPLGDRAARARRSSGCWSGRSTGAASTIRCS